MINFDNLRALDGYRKLTPRGRDHFEKVLASPPARPVGETSLFSNSGAYATARFPHMKEYDSRGCEKPYVLHSIMNEAIVDIIPQPKALSIVRHDKRGRQRPGSYVCDYIECARSQFSIVENKKLADLQRLAEGTRDWQQDIRGQWQYIPAAEVAADFGMGCKVFFPEAFPAAYLVNLQILCRLPVSDLLAQRPKLLGQVCKQLEGGPHSVLDLCREFDGLTGAFLYQALVRERIFGLIEYQHFDLDFVLFRTRKEATTQQIHLKSLAAPDHAAFGPLHQRLMICSPVEKALTVAAQSRYDSRRKAGDPRNATDYRDEVQLRLAAIEGAPRIAAFVRRVGERGGKGQPLTEDQRAPVVQHAHDYFAKLRVPKFSKLRGDFEAYAAQEGLFVPSHEAHRQIFNQEFSPERAAFLTGGKKAFHEARAMVDGANANPRLAIAGLHVHIDGVYGDTWSPPDEDALFLRPIFYPLIDDTTGKVFGRGIKVGRPSRMAVAMAHRDCYTRHKFLPAQIYHDFGSEFYNLFVPDMCAHFVVGYERRPAGAPRFGGLGESFNAQFSAYLQTLAGGTYFDKAGRSADGKRKGRATAELSIPQIVRAADRWIFQTWNTSPIGGEKLSPNQRFENSYRCFPDAFVPVQDSLLARYHTSLPVNVKKFDYRRGFRYGGVKFMSDTLAALLRGKERPSGPRLDCMDPSCIHVMTGGGPATLRSLEFGRAQGLDDGQRMEELSALFSYSSMAKFNQHNRNMKEAMDRRDIEKASAAARDSFEADNAQPAAESSGQKDVQYVDFSSSLEKPIAVLKRLD